MRRHPKPTGRSGIIVMWAWRTEEESVARFICGGLTTFDLGYVADSLPERGAKGTARTSFTDVGGPAANAAVTAALLGSEADVHSVFGTGPFSEEAVRLLTAYGVGVVDHDPSIDLPVASVWIDGMGGRTILSTDNRRSEVESRPELISLDGVTAVLLDGHYPRLQIVLADAARAAGVPIVLDCGRWRPVFADLLSLASDVIMTATFRPPGWEGMSADEAVVSIRDRYGGRLVAASRGPRPILVADGSPAGIPVPEVEVVDTTGAGDVLHGAYLHFRYTEGRSPRDALTAAAEVASNSCRTLGARQLSDESF
jgi:sugar/nucleoside kinase (ribokinase family)